MSPLEFKGSIQLSFDCLHIEWMLVGDAGDMLDAGLCNMQSGKSGKSWYYIV